MECPVCLELCGDEDHLTPCCKKVYHQECLDTWNGPCPTCRAVTVVVVHPEVEVRVSHTRVVCVCCWCLMAGLTVLGMTGGVIFSVFHWGPH